VSADERALGQLREEREGRFQAGARRELLARLDRETAPAGERRDALQTASVGAGHDPLDCMGGERGGQPARVGPTGRVEASSEIFGR
jgi:hypothetical protein